MNLEELTTSSQPFLAWLVDWYNSRPALEWAELLAGAENTPDRVAVLAVDVTSGFAATAHSPASVSGASWSLLPGSSSGPTIMACVTYPAPGYPLGGRSRVRQLSCPLCARNRGVATVPELANLPFSDLFSHRKELDQLQHRHRLDAWLDSHPEVTTFLVVGDCTDLCVYQLAMHLRLRANVLKRDMRVVCP